VALVGGLATLAGLITFAIIDVPQIAQNLGLIDPPPLPTSTPTSTLPPTLTPEPTSPPPHAPSLEGLGDGDLYNERTTLISVPPGGEFTLENPYAEVEALGSPWEGCVNEQVLAYSWQIRDPYPNSGELKIFTPLQGGTRSLLGEGESGRGLAGPCGEFIFVNESLDPYQVEFRYASNPGALGSY
jgi:hypothetical protein